MTSISKSFVECNLRSSEVIDALKSGSHAVIDQVASRIYSNMLTAADAGIQDAADWPQKDEKLKWVLHTQVAVFGDLLKLEDLLERVKSDSFEDHQLITDLEHELKFLLLDLLGLYYDLNYSTWNLMDLFTPDDLTEEHLRGIVEPVVQPPDVEFGAHDESISRVVLNQALTIWIHWSQVYKNLIIRTYGANEDDAIIAFQSVLAVSANLISASHIGSLLLRFRARSAK